MSDFDQIGVNNYWIKKLKEIGIKKPTPIQNLTMLPISNGQDVIAKAKTGSGKTIAFLIPILQQIKENSDGPQALIIVPTRELAKQIESVVVTLTKGSNFKVLSIYGGQDTQKQIKQLKNSIDLIIATPGRLMDHMNRSTMDLSNLKHLVLDEADQMLLLGFKNEVEWIFSKLNKPFQILCFSATITSPVKKLAYKYMHSPLECIVDTDHPLSVMDQMLVQTSDRWKTLALITTLNDTNPFLGIIFCRTIRRLEKLEIALQKEKLNFGVLHGNLSQNVRERVLKNFRNANYQFLLTTDLSSRGLDIQGVSHIYNYDMPETPELYLHRIGRTGRMGEKGMAITFSTPKDTLLLSSIESQLGYKIPVTIFEKPDDHIDTTHDLVKK